MSQYPKALTDLISDFEFITDRNERIEYLIEIADRFEEVKVPESISTAPHLEENHVQFCESEAYVWALDQEDGSVKYYFDVLNPQGLSAMAMAVILSDAYNGQKPDVIAGVNTDIVFKIFGKEISMGKGQGLMGIINMVKAEAQKRL